ncbi:MAG: hypothetical protein ACK58L_04840 [Planctomycetota bacterium]
MPSRREKLENMLQSDPNDQLLRYMLAMELEKESSYEACLQQFGLLMHAPVPYVPAFLMAGQLLTRLDRTSDAKATYLRGIQLANQQGNSHAAGEMSGFLAMLG